MYAVLKIEASFFGLAQLPSKASFQEIESNPVLTYKERNNVEPHVSVFSNNIDLVIVCYKDQIDALNFKI